MGRTVGHFEIIPRKKRVIEAERKVRHWSKLFRKAVADGDRGRAEQISDSAWNALLTLFEGLRNERDHRFLDRGDLQQSVGWIISSASRADQVRAYNERKIDCRHSAYSPLSLEDALNKLAHYDEDLSTYRVDGRNAHYVVLCGRRRVREGTQNWVAEILVSKLCSEVRVAARAVRQFPRRT